MIIDTIIKPAAKAWIAFVGGLLLVVDQAFMTELPADSAWQPYLRVAQVALVFATAGGVYQATNTPKA